MRSSIRRLGLFLTALSMSSSVAAADQSYWFRLGNATSQGLGGGSFDPGTGTGTGTETGSISLAFAPATAGPGVAVDSAPAPYAGPAVQAVLTTTGGLVRTCSDASCSVVVDGFAASVPATSGRFVQVRFPGSADGSGGSVAVSVSAPGLSPFVATFAVGPALGTTSLGTFAALVGVQPEQQVQSSLATYTGPDAQLGLAGSETAAYVVCRGSDCSLPSRAARTVKSGDAIYLTMTSGASGFRKSATLFVGSLTRNWSVTSDIDTSRPDADLSLAFAASVSEDGMPIYSDPAPFDGPSAGAHLTASGGHIRVCDDGGCIGEPDVYDVQADVLPGMYVQARFMDTAGGAGGSVVVDVAPAGSTALISSFVVQPSQDFGTGSGGGTVDDSQFGEFVDVAGAVPATTYASNTVAYSGPPAILTLRGEPSARFAVCRSAVCGPTGMGSVELEAGDVVKLSMKSGQGDDLHEAEVEIVGRSGSVERSWSVGTTGLDDTPDPLFFHDLRSVEPNETIEYMMGQKAKGFEVPVELAVESGDVSVDDGPWVDSATVSPGSWLRFRTTTAPSGERAVRVTFGENDPVFWRLETRSEDSMHNDVVENLERSVVWISKEFYVDPAVVLRPTVMRIPTLNLSANLPSAGPGLYVVSPGDRFRMRLVSHEHFDNWTYASAEIEEFKVKYVFETHTRPPDLKPDPFEFTASRFGVMVFGVSNWVKPTGIEGNINVSLVDPNGSDKIQVWPYEMENEPNEDSHILWATSASIRPGDQFRIYTQGGGPDRYETVRAGHPSDPTEGYWFVKTNHECFSKFCSD